MSATCCCLPPSSSTRPLVVLGPESESGSPFLVLEHLDLKLNDGVRSFQFHDIEAYYVKVGFGRLTEGKLLRDRALLCSARCYCVPCTVLKSMSDDRVIDLRSLPLSLKGYLEYVSQR
ncbi:hypothetical protein CB1_001148010 [Camelus ferus]|nr:hypothetical protein CB1_001148010 [Camelus ferus]